MPIIQPFIRNSRRYCNTVVLLYKARHTASDFIPVPGVGRLCYKEFQQCSYSPNRYYQIL